jgi:hypothetical protein
MKRTVLFLMLALSCQMLMAQTVDDIISEFKLQHGARLTLVPKTLVTPAMDKMTGKASGYFGKSIDSVKVLSVGRCSDEVKQSFAEKVLSLEGNGYYRTEQGNDDVSEMMVLADSDGETASTILILARGDATCALVCVKGSIRLDDVAVLTKICEKFK